MSKLFIFLIFFLWLSPPLLGSEDVPDEDPCPEQLVEDFLTNGELLPEFERHFPRFENSFRALDRQAFRKIHDLYAKIPNSTVLLPKDAIGELSVREAIKRVKEARLEISRFFQKLSRDQSYQIRQLDQKASKVVSRRMDPKKQRVRARALEPWVKAFSIISDMFATKKMQSEREIVLDLLEGETTPDLERLNLEALMNRSLRDARTNKVFDEKFGAWASRLEGLWGEVRVALLVPEFVGISVAMGSFNGSSSFLPRYPVNRLHVLDQNSDIDVLFKKDSKTILWGEVKNLRQPVELNTIQWARVEANALRYQRIQQQLGIHVPVVFFFLNGISDEARAELDKFGVKIYPNALNEVF